MDRLFADVSVTGGAADTAAGTRDGGAIRLARKEVGQFGTTIGETDSQEERGVPCRYKVPFQ